MRRRDFIAGATLTAWSMAAPAQQLSRSRGLRRIGVVSPSVPVTEMSENASTSDVYPGFFREMRRLGYVEGQNLAVERRSAEGMLARYDDIAKDLTDQKVEVVFVSTTRMAEHFKSSSTPVVVAGAGLIATGLVESLSHPGGNITGFSVDAGLELYGKYLQLLRDLTPNLKKVGFFAPRSEWEIQVSRAASIAATDMGIAVIGPPVEAPLDEHNYRTALKEMIEQGVDALLVSLAAENVGRAGLIVDFVREHRLPAIYPVRSYIQKGALLTYASDLGEIGKGVARYVDLILKGTLPKDLPIQQPVKFELTIHLKTAKVMGLSVPPALMASADKVIE